CGLPCRTSSSPARLRNPCAPTASRQVTERNYAAGSGAATGSASTLLLAQHQVHHPAPANVGTETATVVEDVIVLAPGVLERVGQNGHRGEVTRLIHLARQGNGSAGAPRRGEGDRAERVAEDVVGQLALGATYLYDGRDIVRTNPPRKGTPERFTRRPARSTRDRSAGRTAHSVIITHSRPHSFEFRRRGNAIGDPLRKFDHTSAPLVVEQVPDLPATRTGEETQLPPPLLGSGPLQTSAEIM